MQTITRALLLFVLLTTASPAQPPASHQGPWLFAGFKSNGEDGVYLALSRDGYHWHLIHHAQPVILPTQPGELMRDPFLQRAPDNTFRMVWTWSWTQPDVLGFSSSQDILHWTPHQQLNVLPNEPTAHNAWAPALYWQPAQRNWLLIWSTTIPGRFPGPKTQANGLDHRIFSTTTADFKTFTPTTVFFDPGYSVIDATFLDGHPDTLIFKDERESPLEKHLRTVHRNPDGTWATPSKPFSETWSEGPSSIAVNGGTLVYYDHYRPPQHYAATFSPTGNSNWQDATPQIDFPAGLRHGSFLKITATEYSRLEALP